MVAVLSGGVVALLIVEDHLRRRFAQSDLPADLLDLRGLLFYRRSEGCNLFL